MSNDCPTTTHIDVHDRLTRERWTQHFGVTDERLRKAVRMVGSRVTTVADYLAPTKP